MRRRTVSWLPVLTAAALLLLPLLAWLQYSWLNQIADADRERRQRTLDTAVMQLSHELDMELSRAFFGLQVKPSSVETQTWDAYRERFDTWAAGATHADIVERVYLAEALDESPGQAPRPRLRAWNATPTPSRTSRGPRSSSPCARMCHPAPCVWTCGSRIGRARSGS